jgi:hypothetical protein
MLEQYYTDRLYPLQDRVLKEIEKIGEIFFQTRLQHCPEKRAKTQLISFFFASTIPSIGKTLLTMQKTKTLGSMK